MTRRYQADDQHSDEPIDTTNAGVARPWQWRGRGLSSLWLTYSEAAAYCRWSVGHLRNLVSAGQIPVYGKPRRRRFRRDMLDLYLTDPDAALRKFRSERNTHGG